MFDALVAYKEAQGDCFVPPRWKANTKLAYWCERQRMALKNNRLAPDRVQRLQQIGFLATRNEFIWQEMFAALIAYKEAHGDCEASQKRKDNPRLTAWCVTQRNAYRLNKLSSERLQRLKEIGFRLDARNPGGD